MNEIEKELEEMRKERCIICPHCGHEHDPSFDPEMLSGLVTYHGDEPPQEFQCQSCEKTFFVQEHVRRTFEEKKTLEEFGGV